MFDALKTDDKFNPYLIILPAFGALGAYQAGLIVGGWIKLSYQDIKAKKTQK
jgi:hypothetical protein